MSAGASFQRRLEHCRRRLRSISVCQHVVLAMSIALLGAGVVVALGRFPRDLASVVSGVALALSAAAGVWLGIRRTPSLGAVAAAVDRRLGLHDSTVTALECIGAVDPMSTLVVRNADALTDGIAPAALFRFSLLPYAKPLAVAALAMTLLATMRLSEPGSWSNSRGIRVPAGSTDAGETTAGGERPSRSQSAARPETRSGSSAPPAAAESPRDADRSAADQSRASLARDVPKDPTATRTSEATTRGSAESPARSGDATQGDAAAGGGRAGSNGRGGSGAARDGGRGGSAPGEAGAPGAGGVRGQRAGGDTWSEALTPLSGSYATRYGLAARQADEALREGRVPPHLRGYVRRYFNGIRPDQHP